MFRNDARENDHQGQQHERGGEDEIPRAELGQDDEVQNDQERGEGDDERAVLLLPEGADREKGVRDAEDRCRHAEDEAGRPAVGDDAEIERGEGGNDVEDPADAGEEKDVLALAAAAVCVVVHGAAFLGGVTFPIV